MKRKQTKLYGPIVTLWLTLSIASVLMAWATWKSLSQHVEESVKVAAFNDALNGLLIAFLDAETGQRGYAMTGSTNYLEPLLQSETNFPKEFDRLADLALGDRTLQKEVLNLRAIAEARMTVLRQVVDLRREKGFDAANSLVMSGRGKVLMDRFRSEIATMRRQRPNILTDSGGTTREQLNRASVASLAAGLFGIGAGFIALYLTRVALSQEKRERLLAEAKLQAEQSSEHKSAFLANMSHEIRTPMNAILGFSDLLGGSIQDPKQRQWLKSIRTSADSLLQLINDVLDMSKIEAGLLELHPEPTDPREICAFIHTVFTEQATRKGVSLSCDVQESLPLALLLDRTRLRQVLVNLVGNSVKFTDTGFIRVSVRWEKIYGGTSRGALLIDVEDSGIGIKQDRIDAIFKPFVQADPTRPQEKQGTGLGLSIVRRLVEMMGGTVTVASVVGEGTTFHLRLPDVAVSARLAQAGQSEQDDAVDFNTLKPSTLVIVDDNPTNRQLMAGIFESTHHRVHFGTNGQSAVDLTQTVRPDLVLLDVRMPEMGGREALELIRAMPGLDTLPVIVVTASSMADQEELLRRKFSGYIRKPFTRRTLFDEMALFLPKVSNATPEPTEPLAPAVPEKQRGNLAELAIKLHAIESKEWPMIRDSLAINEAKAFAKKLRELGESAGCPQLVSYAERLLRHAEAYAIADLEKDLASFSKEISQIEQLTV